MNEAVLFDGGSASAAEIFAAALQESADMFQLSVQKPLQRTVQNVKRIRRQ